MVATTAARGLSTADLATIRATLDAGRKPKVVFTEAAGQIAGQFGQVVELIDPPVDEWVVVRFGHDELPFSPIDLAIPPRATPKPRVNPAADEPADRPAPAEIPYETSATAPSTMAPSTMAPSAAERLTTERPSVVPPPRQEVSLMTTPSTADSSADAAKPVRKAAVPRTPKVKAPATLTVTIAYADGEWMVGAQQGTKALAKPYVIKAAEALRMVALLDVPGVHEAVEQIVDAERQETQAHAQRLRAELAEIEARLADLPSPR